MIYNGVKSSPPHKLSLPVGDGRQRYTNKIRPGELHFGHKQMDEGSSLQSFPLKQKEFV